MLPVPYIDYIPVWFDRDKKVKAYTDKVDNLLNGIKKETLEIERLIDCVRCPAALLDEYGYTIAAKIYPSDSTGEKRKKICSAIPGHKMRGTWKWDVKPKIDIVAGGDAKLFISQGVTTWVLTGDGLTPSAYLWGSVGDDGAGTWGLDLEGSGVDRSEKGVVFIDVDNSTLTAAEIEKIKLNLDDSNASYFRVYLGYVSGGNFIKYANGQIY